MNIITRISKKSGMLAFLVALLGHHSGQAAVSIQDALSLAGVGKTVAQGMVKTASAPAALPAAKSPVGGALPQSVAVSYQSATDFIDQATLLQMTAVDIARGGTDPLMVGISQGRLYMLQATSWVDITGNIDQSVAAVSIAADRTIWVLDAQGSPWRRLPGETAWKKIAGTLKTISIGNQKEVWGTGTNNKIYRKIDAAGIDDQAAWKDRWFTIPDQKSINVACGGDGVVWSVNTDGLEVVTFDRAKLKWKSLIRSADLGLGSALRIKIADSYNILFVSQKGDAWRLIPGQVGSAKSDWKKIESYRFFDASIGIDGTIIGVDMQKNFIIIRPEDDKDTSKNLDAARGSPVITGQVCRLVSAWDGRRVWTHGYSPFDADGKNAAPENHIGLLAGVTEPDFDFKQDQGSFFKVTDPKNMAASRTLQYDDPIEVWSLYACPGDPSKSGGLGQEWKWWMYDQHHKWGEHWRNVVVSLMRYVHTSNGNQLFSIRSPYGRTGPVCSNDVVEIVSLAPHAKNCPLFIHPWSVLEGGCYEIIASDGSREAARWGGTYSAFGPFEASGMQLFQLQQIKEADVHPEARTQYRRAIGLDVSDEIFGKLDPKSSLKLDTSAGLALMETLQNETPFLLTTNILGNVPANESIDNVNKKLDQIFTFEGTGMGEELPFAPDSIWQCAPMYSRSIAWIAKAIDQPGATTMIFLAQGTDDGDIQLVFGNKIGPDCAFKIHIGTDDNSKSAIVVDDKPFAQVDASVSELARIQPNAWVPYWVSLNDNFLMIGSRDVPGKGIFLSAYLPIDTSKIDRIGFSCHKGKISCANAQFGKPVVVQSMGDIYDGSLQSNLDIPADPRAIAWYSKPLRVFNEGMVAFDVTAQHTVTVVLATQDQKDQYQIVLGAEGNSQAYIYKNGQKVVSVSLTESGLGKVFSDRTNTFWVSMISGLILVGSGDVGTNMFLAWQDDKYIKGISSIGFRGSDHQQQVTKIQMLPPVDFSTAQEEATYSRVVQQVPYSGSIQMLYGFSFQVLQDGQQLVLKDNLTGKNHPVLKAPTQGSTQRFRLNIWKDGTPNFIPVSEAQESEEQVTLKQEANIAQAVGQANLQAASAVSLGGADMVSGLAALATGTAFSAAGIAAMTVAAKKNAELNARYRSPASYVYLEQYARDAGVQLTVNTDDQTNGMIIRQLIVDASKLAFDVVDDFYNMIQIYQNLISYVTSAATVRDPGVRQTIFSTLETAMRTCATKKDEYPLVVKEKLMNVLIDFYSNAYFIDQTNRMDVVRKQAWYDGIVTLGEELLLQSTQSEVTIRRLYGEYLWYPFPLAIDDQGYVAFEVNANTDVFVGFSQQPVSARTLSDNKMYEIVLGARLNATHEIRIKSMGSPAAIFERSRDKTAMLRPNQYDQYWISLYNGLIKVGKGAPGSNVLLEWRDPFPWKGIQRVGVGSWDTDMKIRNFQIGKFSQPQPAPKPVPRPAVPASTAASQPASAPAAVSTPAATKLPGVAIGSGGSVSQNVAKLAGVRL